MLFSDRRGIMTGMRLSVFMKSGKILFKNAKNSHLKVKKKNLITVYVC